MKIRILLVACFLSPVLLPAQESSTNDYRTDPQNQIEQSERLNLSRGNGTSVENLDIGTGWALGISTEPAYFWPNGRQLGIAVKFPDFVPGISLTERANFTQVNSYPLADWAISIDTRATFSTLLLLNFLKLYAAEEISAIFRSSGKKESSSLAVAPSQSGRPWVTHYYDSPAAFDIGCSTLIGFSTTIGKVFAIFTEGGLEYNPYFLYSYDSGGIGRFLFNGKIRVGIDFLIPASSSLNSK